MPRRPPWSGSRRSPAGAGSRSRRPGDPPGSPARTDAWIRLSARSRSWLYPSTREDPPRRDLILTVVSPDQENLRDAVLQQLGVVEEVGADLQGLARDLLHRVVPVQTLERGDPVHDVEDAAVAG